MDVKAPMIGRWLRGAKGEGREWRVDTYVGLRPQDSSTVPHDLGRSFVRDSTLVLKVLQQQAAVRNPMLIRQRAEGCVSMCGKGDVSSKAWGCNMEGGKGDASDMTWGVRRSSVVSWESRA